MHTAKRNDHALPLLRESEGRLGVQSIRLHIPFHINEGDLMTDSWRGYGKKTLGVALIGSGFMGTVHTRAYKALPLTFPMPYSLTCAW